MIDIVKLAETKPELAAQFLKRLDSEDLDALSLDELVEGEHRMMES